MCIFLYIDTFMNKHIFTCRLTYKYIHVYICIYIWVYIYVCMYTYICIYIYIYTYIDIFLFIYIYICVCIYIHIYISSWIWRKYWRIHTYIPANTHGYIHLQASHMCMETARKWSAPSKSGGLHWATYKAHTRRFLLHK